MSENKGGLISREALMRGRVCNDPVRIAAMCEPAVDAVEVVRCKDCRYSRGMNDAEKKLYFDEVLICTSGDMGTGVECPVFQNDYCSYGERKDGADNG